MVSLTLLELQKQVPLQKWCFENESLIRVGRSTDNDVVLTDNLVSRHHLEIWRDANSNDWQVLNHGTNGTFLNGLLIHQSHLLDNSLLQLAKGGPVLQFQIQDQRMNQNTNIISSNCTHEGNPPENLFCIHCGQPLSVETTILNYRILRALGKGGMGTTYLAWDGKKTVTSKPQLLVLKQMNADMAKVAKARELFEREANTLKSLHHPGIPKYYDFFVEGGKKYLAMELVHGQDLEKLVYLKGPISPQQAITWMIETCDILDYLHSQQPPLIHRDIKPANLMVRSYDNQIVVLDFGAVKEIGTTFGTRIGAEGYCAPEQERGQPLTQSDLYAIGPTLIFLLTGGNPFKFYRLQGRDFRFHIENVTNITAGLREVIGGVTEPLPCDRYQTARELASALEKCQY